MKNAAQAIALAIVGIFLCSLSVGMMTDLYREPSAELEPEPVVQLAPSDPGHNVFAQYLTSDNCSVCAAYGSPAHDQAKNSLPGRYVYISYHGASFSNLRDAEAGNIAPIYGVNHLKVTSGAPKTSFGDENPISGCGSRTCWDPYISSGGNMHITATDYAVLVEQTANSGGTTTIDISVSYAGTGTAPANLVLYAAVTEKVCHSHPYNDGSKGHNCWESWLLNNGGYTSASGSVVNGGTGFEILNLGSGKVTKSWTVPTNLVSGGVSNMNTVAALYSTWSTSSNMADVYGASDSTIGATKDLAVSGLTITNNQGASSYLPGDIITLEADVKNVDFLDYNGGGSLQFYHKNGATSNTIASVNIPAINAAPGSPHFTGTATFDTSNIQWAENAWSTNFGARIVGANGDSRTGNNVVEVGFNHDRVPLAKAAQVVGLTEVDRGGFVTILARGVADDNVDNIDSMSFDVEVSATGQNNWDSTVVSGGDTVLYRDSPSEGREYFVTPTGAMASGDYDVRTRTVDNRGQTSDWLVASAVFELANGRPIITADPVPTVMCDLSTRVSMVDHITDPETSLSDLVVSSSSPNFVAWHPSSEEIEVIFPYENGCPLGQKGIEIRVDDGGDYSGDGELPYGTLLFNVIENGQPRWDGLPIQVVDEGGTGFLMLGTFLSDTDDTGASVDASTLSLQIIENSNPDVITAELNGNTLGYQTVDDDVNGLAVITLRASDGESFSDQTVTIRINPVNDAPRLDLTGIEEIDLKTNEPKIINLNSRLTDIDSPEGTYMVEYPESTERGSARLLENGELFLEFEQVGPQVVTITTTDGYAENTYEIAVNVFDSVPFVIAKTDDGSGHMYVKMMNTYETQTPIANFSLTDAAPSFTLISMTWNLCTELTGNCEGFWQYDLDMSRSTTGWSQEMNIPSDDFGGLARPNGMRNMDYISLDIRAVDTSGQEYKTTEPTKWLTTEPLPSPDAMDAELLAWYVSDLEADIANTQEQIANDVSGDIAALEQILMTLKSDYKTACEDTRAVCQSDGARSNAAEDESSALSTDTILIVLGVLILAALLGLIFTRNNSGRPEELKWDPTNLPAHDMVANSMYGGAQQLFQQPAPHVAAVAQQPTPYTAPVVQHPAPVSAIVEHTPAPQPAGPPLPSTGLPAGWTMEQWAYYGQQYLDRLRGQ